MNEATKFKVEVKRWKLEKFDGDRVDGDGKEPVEYIEGGDGLPTVHYIKVGDSFHGTHQRGA